LSKGGENYCREIRVFRGAPIFPPARRNSPYLLQGKSIQVTPLPTPTNISGFGDNSKETKSISGLDDLGNSGFRRPISLVAVRNDSEGDGLGSIDIESTKVKPLKV